MHTIFETKSAWGKTCSIHHTFEMLSNLDTSDCFGCKNPNFFITLGKALEARVPMVWQQTQDLWQLGEIKGLRRKAPTHRPFAPKSQHVSAPIGLQGLLLQRPSLDLPNLLFEVCLDQKISDKRTLWQGFN